MKLPAIRLNPLGICVLCGLVILLIFMYSSSYFDGGKNATISLKRLLAVGIAVAEAGGLKVREIRMSSDIKERSKGKTEEGKNDPLTAGDIESHKIMLHSLKTLIPKLRVISEEHDDSKFDISSLKLPTPSWDIVKKITDDIDIPAEDILVWIDPLDATQEYTEKNLVHFVTTMVCVAVRGKPIIGIIRKPFQNVTVWAWENHGMSDNLPTTPKPDPGDSPIIIVSRSHAGKVTEVAKAVFGSTVKIVSAGGAGYKSIEIAEGKADAYIHVTPIKKWDICAGNAILNALGGHMTTMDGELIDYSDPTQEKNNKGLLATLLNHNKYLEKVTSLRN